MQEFFTENHWEKLPRSWRETLSGADMREAGRLLLTHHGAGYTRETITHSTISYTSFALLGPASVV